MQRLLRVFVALAPPPEVRRRLAALAAAAGLAEAGFRLVAEPEIHLTLRFLGSMPEGRVAELGASLRRSLRGLPAPELALGSPGAFPAPGRPRVAWVGLGEAPGAEGRLARVQAGVREATVALGYALDEREAREPWRAHLTLARARPERRGAVPDAFLALAPEGTWTAREVLVLESRLERPPGERYAPLARVALG